MWGSYSNVKAVWESVTKNLYDPRKFFFLNLKIFFFETVFSSHTFLWATPKTQHSFLFCTGEEGQLLSVATWLELLKEEGAFWYICSSGSAARGPIRLATSLFWWITPYQVVLFAKYHAYANPIHTLYVFRKKWNIFDQTLRPLLSLKLEKSVSRISVTRVVLLILFQCRI